MLGVNPDPSAAQLELLTAKMPPKDVAGLKRLFPRRGFVEQWNHLEQSAKEFSKDLLGKNASTPSTAWKLLVSHQAEPVLWLAFSSKNAAVKEKFNNFFNVWPEARQKIPTTIMAEMRITPDLPDYGKVAELLFFQFMDGKLQTEEELRAFLAPFSPPAPPPPVVIRRPRGRRAEIKIEEEEEVEAPVRNADDESDDADERDALPSVLGGDAIPLPPRKGAAPAKPGKGAKAAPGPIPAKSAKESAKPTTAALKPGQKLPAAKVPEKPKLPAAKVPEKAPAKAAAKPEPKAPAQAPEKKPAPKPPAKKPAPKPAAKAAAKKAPAKTAAKKSPKPAAKKPAPKKQAPARKPAKPAKKPQRSPPRNPASPRRRRPQRKNASLPTPSIRRRAISMELPFYPLRQPKVHFGGRPCTSSFSIRCFPGDSLPPPRSCFPCSPSLQPNPRPQPPPQPQRPPKPSHPLLSLQASPSGIFPTA